MLLVHSVVIAQKNMKRTNKLAMIYYGLCAVMTEVMDGLEGTPFYRQKIKNLSNQLLKELEEKNAFIYDMIDEDTEKHYQSCCTIAENFAKAIGDKDIDLVYAVMKELNEGGIKVVDENKHRKFINQLDTI